jgi:hypothetical protein
VRGDEPLELRDDLGVTAEREIGVDPLLDRAQAEVLEPVDVGAGEVLVPEVGERLAAKEIERRTEELALAGRVTLAVRPFEKALDAAEVRPLAIDAQGIAGRPRLDRVRAEQLPQRGDVALEGVRRSLRRRGAPERLDQLVGGNHLVRAQEEERQQHPLLRPWGCYVAPVLDDFERPQNPDFHPAPIVAWVRARVSAA